MAPRPQSPKITRPVSAFVLWLKDYKDIFSQIYSNLNKIEQEHEDLINFGEIRSEPSELSFKENSQIMGNIWKNLPEEARNIYIDKALHLRQIYDQTRR